MKRIYTALVAISTMALLFSAQAATLRSASRTIPIALSALTALYRPLRVRRACEQAGRNFAPTQIVRSSPELGMRLRQVDLVHMLRKKRHLPRRHAVRCQACEFKHRAHERRCPTRSARPRCRRSLPSTYAAPKAKFNLPIRFLPLLPIWSDRAVHDVCPPKAASRTSLRIRRFSGPVLRRRINASSAIRAISSAQEIPRLLECRRDRL